MTVKYYVGTSGFTYAHWREVFYPKGVPQRKWLEFYAERFGTVEMNNPFYRLPAKATFQAWRERTPAGFVFAVKASRYITHIRRLQAAEEPVRLFVERARSLGDKLGPILYQTPSGFKMDLEVLDAFLRKLPSGLRHVMEFRDQSWHTEPVFDLLRRHKVALCVHDWHGQKVPVAAPAGFAYFRFHGPSGKYEGKYSAARLRSWATRIRSLGSGVKTVYVYFNNDAGGHALEDAKTMEGLLLTA